MPINTISDVKEGLRSQHYVASDALATSVFLALRLNKPLLVEGPAGVGKTQLAKALSAMLQRELVRLQCYEGLDDSKALYEWEYSKQLLYTQMLKERVNDVLGSEKNLSLGLERLSHVDSLFFSEHFLLPRPLLRAIRNETPTVLLIDEIDKADNEFEAFLLEVLSDYAVTIPELGTLRARHLPVTVLTSNNARDLSDALRRRCLHVWIDYPKTEHELEIVQTHLPHSGDVLLRQVVQFVQRIRQLPLKKLPSIAETVDWAQALIILGASELGSLVVRQSLEVLLKYTPDVRKIEQQIDSLVADAKDAS